MMESLTFSASMENSISEVLQELRGGCSPEINRVLDSLLRFHGEFERLMSEVKELPENQPWPELSAADFVGTDEVWRELTGSINPGTSPNTADYATLWCIHALLDKSAQFYQQAARQNLPEPERLFLSSVAELKLMLRRRIDAVERVVANQVWKAVGFPPGLLGRE